MSKFKWPGWRSKQAWPPDDPPGFVFLGRAFDVMGQARFHHDWTGDELYEAQEELPPRVPSVDEAFPKGLSAPGIHAHYGPYVKAALGRAPADDQPIEAADWESVFERVDRERFRVISAQYRLCDLAEVCAKLAQRGALIFASRPKVRGGLPILIQPADWHIDYPITPFSTLGTDGVRSLGLCAFQPVEWLFVTLASLNDVIENGALLSEPPPNLDRPRVKSRTYRMQVGPPLPPASLLNDNLAGVPHTVGPAPFAGPADPPTRPKSVADDGHSEMGAGTFDPEGPPLARIGKYNNRRPTAQQQEAFRFLDRAGAYLPGGSRPTARTQLWRIYLRQFTEKAELKPPLKGTALGLTQFKLAIDRHVAGDRIQKGRWVEKSDCESD